MEEECNKKVGRVEGRSSIGLSHCCRLPVMWTSSREDRGDNSDWIRERFSNLYYLNAT